jgi:hypothetical protein
MRTSLNQSAPNFKFYHIFTRLFSSSPLTSFLLFVNYSSVYRPRSIIKHLWHFSVWNTLRPTYGNLKQFTFARTHKLTVIISRFVCNYQTTIQCTVLTSKLPAITTENMAKQIILFRSWRVCALPLSLFHLTLQVLVL